LTGCFDESRDQRNVTAAQLGERHGYR